MQQEEPVEEGEKYNPYLYDASGPKSKRLGLPEANNDNDLYDFDMDETMQAAFNADGQYSVKHQNEKFKLGSMNNDKQN
jgi:hypothetical protein